MPNLVKRTIFGAIYVALILGSMFAGPLWFRLLMLVFGIFAVIEIRQTCQPADYPAPCFVADMLTIGALLVAVAMADTTPISPILTASMLALAFGAFLSRICLTIFIAHKDAFRSLAVSAFMLLYVGASLSFTGIMYYDRTTLYVLLALFVMLWANDTGAYLVGCTFGRHRLCERLSPKKSWEGFWGGAAAALIAAGIFAWLVPGVSIWWWFVEAVVVIGFGTIGDLLESLMKRSAGVKDSGHLIPGHGGILDRIDSLLLAGPVVAVLSIFIW